MTWAGRSRSRSLALPVSARTRRTSPGGNALAITPRLMWSLTRMPAGRPAGMRAIIAARPRASASMAQLSPYVNRIGVSRAVAALGAPTAAGGDGWQGRLKKKAPAEGGGMRDIAHEETAATLP